LWEIELIKTTIVDEESIAVIRYLGSCRADGSILRPEQVLLMLSEVRSQHSALRTPHSALRTSESEVIAEFQMLHIHRQRLVSDGDV
jgi:uncharacterized protein (DUF2344 family)